MRLSERRNVDLPQPDGPMSAVTVFSGKASETFSTALCLPKKHDSSSVRMGTLRPG